jgi:DNA polymerase/3'-5' exonuclease PolX
MRLLQAVARLLDPSPNSFILKDAEKQVRLVMRRCAYIPDPVAQLCALRETTSIQFDVLMDMYSRCRQKFRNDLGFPMIEEAQLRKGWSTLYEPTLKLIEKEGPVIGQSTLIFLNTFVVFVPLFEFSMAQAQIQLQNVVKLGGVGLVHRPSSMSACPLSRRALSGRALCVVCPDPVVARRVVLYRHGHFSVYSTNFVPHSVRDGVVKSARAYAHPDRIGHELPTWQRASSRTPHEQQSMLEPLELGKRGNDETSSGMHQDIHRVSKRAKLDPSHSFACVSARTKKELELMFPNNALICDNLTILLDFYSRHCQVNKCDTHSSFRCSGYQKAIALVRRLDYDITGLEDIEHLRTNSRIIGSKLHLKIKEIVQTGRLREAEAKLCSSLNRPLKELCSIWGVGPATASNLIAAGISNVKDLRSCIFANPSILDRQQQIGLKHYEDLLKRIPREEVQKIEVYLKRMVQAIAGDTVKVIIAGSYLRGKSSCGDVDCMLHGERGQVERVMATLVRRMASEQVLTDHLVWGTDKYFGVYQLSSELPHRRLDIFAVPNEEFPFSLLTFTGSGLFNRSMRLRARQLGFSLSHKGISRVSRRCGRAGKDRLDDDIRMTCEKDIFRFLGMPYKSPCDRDI